MKTYGGRLTLFLYFIFITSCSGPEVEQILVEVPKNTIVPRDMAYIPEGEFIMGTPKDSRTQGGKKIWLDAYLIDRYEITRKQYSKFKPTYTFHPRKENYPINHVNFYNADSYCRSKGKRLPTEAEWEKAARGTDSRKWPWRVFNSHPNNGFSGFIPEPISKRKEWISPYGIYGMGHNVWEWISDWYSYEGMPDDAREKFKVIRGGVIQTHLTVQFSPTWFRNYMEPEKQFNFIGFRCARDEKGE